MIKGEAFGEAVERHRVLKALAYITAKRGDGRVDFRVIRHVFIAAEREGEFHAMVAVGCAAEEIKVRVIGEGDEAFELCAVFELLL